MSPIVDLQRRLVEVGRLRMGSQVPHGQSTRPKKLDHWRVTSRDRARLEAISGLYGGTVQPWEGRDGEYEVFTTTAELPIMLIPGQALNQWWELWSGGGCQRRCDGVREVKTANEDVPCICDTEKGDRKCKPTSRLSVVLPDIPGFGTFMLETHGIYAAIELAGTAAILERATAGGQMFPARLRIDQRSKIDAGKTTRWAVPVIDIDTTVREALALEAPAGYTPLIQSVGVTVEQGLAAVAKEREPRTGNGRQQAELGPVVEIDFPDTPIPVLSEPPPEPVVAQEPPGTPVQAQEEHLFEPPAPAVITDAQRRLLFTICTKGEVPEHELRQIIFEVTEQESTKLIAPWQFDKVLERLNALLPEGRA